MTTKTTQTIKMTNLLAMWKQESKSGKPYFSGKLSDGTKLLGFYNTYKKNPNEPDVRIYKAADLESKGAPILSMWCNVSKKGNKYLSGTYQDKRVVGFINEKAEGNKPYFTVSISED